MTPEQYQRVTEIFNQVIESPSDQQAGLLFGALRRRRHPAPGS
jgi:hypothetical protein